MNREYESKTAIFAEDRAFDDRRRIGVLLVPQPAEGLTMPHEIVDPVTAGNESKIADRYPEAWEFLDGSRADNQPFVYVGYLLRRGCELSLDDIAGRVAERLNDYQLHINEADTTSDLVDIYVKEHRRMGGWSDGF